VELNITLVVQAILVLGLLLFLGPVLFAPMMRVFDERERRILGAQNEAKRLLGAASEQTSIVDAKTREAEAESRQVLQALRIEGRAKEQQIVEAAKATTAARLDEARAELFERAEQARNTLKVDSNAISDEIVKKILGRAA
jgi:F-type H+-transporting ATPase subunit b